MFTSMSYKQVVPYQFKIKSRKVDQIDFINKNK